MNASRPSITIHWAQTLDGRIATRDGFSQWLSGDASLTLAHRLRADHQGVMVGIGTVLADDPRLTTRLVQGKSPRRIILDSRLRVPLESRVLRDAAHLTLVATTDESPAERRQAVRATGASLMLAPSDATGRVDLAAVTLALGEQGISSVLVEGGSRLITSLLRQGLADRIVITMCPKVLGAGIEAVGDLGISSLDRCLTFERHRFEPVGPDIVFDGQLAKRRVSWPDQERRDVGNQCP